VARRRCRTTALDALGEDRAVDELRIASTMIEVEVTVDHHLDVLEVDAGAGEGGDQAMAQRAVVDVDLRIAPYPCIDQQ
jgi:hypothetical protein